MNCLPLLLSLLLVAITAARPTLSDSTASKEKATAIELGDTIVLPTNFPTPEGYNIARHMLEVDHREKMNERRQIEAKFEEANKKTANKYWVYWLIMSRILG